MKGNLVKIMELFMHNSKSPCYGCKERKPSCHDNCQKYIEWKNAYQKKKDAAYIYYQGERDVERYQFRELEKGKVLKEKMKR